MGRVGKLSGSWRNRVQWVAAVVVQPAHRSVTSWLAAEDATREVELQRVRGRAQLLS